MVDGLDGSGKSTAADILAEGLRARGRTVVVHTHPGDGSFAGRVASECLLKRGRPAILVMAFFYFVDILHSIWVLRRSDRDYDDVIFVRYLLEAAYFPDSLYRVGHAIPAGVLPEPDVSILVDVDPDVAMERVRSRGGEVEVYENPAHMERTRRHMLELSEGWHVIDNNGSEERLESQLHTLLDSIL